MAGGPSHLETFDFKPKLARMDGQPMPESLTAGQQLAQLQGQKLVCWGPQTTFKRFGRCGAEMTELFPHVGGIVGRDLHRPLDDHRRDQSRSGAHVHEHRLANRWPALDGVVGHLRPGQRRRGFAGLRRAGLARRWAVAATYRHAAMVFRFFAEPLPGRATCAARAIRCFTSPIRPA